MTRITYVQDSYGRPHPVRDDELYQYGAGGPVRVVAKTVTAAETWANLEETGDPFLHLIDLGNEEYLISIAFKYNEEQSPDDAIFVAPYAEGQEGINQYARSGFSGITVNPEASLSQSVRDGLSIVAYSNGGGENNLPTYKWEPETEYKNLTWLQGSGVYWTADGDYISGDGSGAIISFTISDPGLGYAEDELASSLQFDFVVQSVGENGEIIEAQLVATHDDPFAGTFEITGELAGTGAEITIAAEDLSVAGISPVDQVTNENILVVDDGFITWTRSNFTIGDGSQFLTFWAVIGKR